MAGIDSYTKLLLHCDGTDGSTIFTDDSAESHSVTANADAQIDTAIQKFGTGSGLLDGTGDYLSISDVSDWDFGTADFTIDFWYYRNGSQANFSSLVSTMPPSGDGWAVMIGYGGASGGDADKISIVSTASGGLVFDIKGGVTLSDQTWTHIAVVRYNNTLKTYIDGVEDQTKDVTGYDYTNNTNELLIGRYYTTIDNYYVNGNIDEVRISKGVARWTSNFTPPTAPYTGDVATNINETATLNDNWQVQPNPDIFSFNEIAFLSDTWNVITNQKFINETTTLDDSWILDTNPKTEQLIESTTLDDTWTLDISGDIFFRYNTDLRTTLSKVYKYMTNLVVNVFKINKYDTNLTTKIDAEYKYNTDLRVRADAYNDVSPGNLNDIIVKLDGSELTDVDYSTLRIQYNLNTTPSYATFQLARRHDNLDYLLDGVTSSTITNENKIEIYDGTYKLLTAYITQITGLSRTDTVAIIAEDIRYKLSRNSMEIEYGGKIEQDENDLDTYNRTEISIGTAISQVLSTISSYVSGYEGVPFSTTYTPEYTKTYGDLSTLLNQLVTQTANVNWYIDENEYLRFQKVDSGTIKELALSSLSGSRHVYDVVLSDVTLNKQKSGYAKSLNVKLGQHIIQKWSRRTFTGWLNSYVDFFNSLKEKTSFCFQQWGEGYWKSKAWYCGVNKTIYSYNNRTWVLKPTIVVQHQSKDSDDDLADITVGSGSPQKTIHLNSYGKKETSVRWEERIKESDDKSYLVYVQDDEYDHTSFAQDFANFDLSQNNKLQTSANVTLLLNAYKYYNIKLKDRINLSNTIGASIYKNNNEFPLNVDSILIDCSTRIVTLNLTNYGKSWGVKTGNYLTNTTIPKIQYVMEKQNVVRYSGS